MRHTANLGRHTAHAAGEQPINPSSEHAGHPACSILRNARYRELAPNNQFSANDHPRSFSTGMDSWRKHRVVGALGAESYHSGVEDAATRTL